MSERPAIRSLAIIPAAGACRRMGRPKLTLPWGGSTIIESVLDAWQAGGVERIIVVVRPGDARLAALCRRSDVDIVVPDIVPEDMKASIRIGLAHAQGVLPLANRWCWLTAPADIPELAPRVIQRLKVEYAQRPGSAIIPVYGGRRGHPVLLPSQALEILETLPVEASFKDLFSAISTREIPCGPAALCRDLDTPEDYQRQS